MKTDKLQIYENKESFELAQRMANSLASSDIVPLQYQKNIPNTLIAMEMANRLKMSPLMVMQHLNIIHGKPSWSSTFIISSINTSGRFSPLRFEISGKGENLSCYAWAKDNDGNTLKGTTVTYVMAKAEGWVDKKGSKWVTMPELMIQYRAAAFWGRLYAPELTMGMQSAEEVIDVVYEEVVENLEDNFANEEVVKTEVIENKKVPENKSKEKDLFSTEIEPVSKITDYPESDEQIYS